MGNALTTIEVLKLARTKIEKPENWCQNDYARRADGAAISPMNAEACRFCAMGACMSASGNPDPLGQWQKVLARTMEYAVHCWNDRHSHVEVLDAFDKAIALAESEVKS